MKLSHKILTTAAIALSMAATVDAQTFQTGYFLEGYSYKYQLNPAFDNERGFIGLILGPASANTWSNLGVSTFVYPQSTKAVFFTNNNVSRSKFLRKLSIDGNYIRANVDYTLASGGFRLGRFYNTVELNVHTNATANLPYDLFRFLKDSSAGSSFYDLSGLEANARAYAELAYGLSTYIGTDVRVGGRVKLLFGGANASAAASKLFLDLTGNSEADGKIALTSDAEIRASGALKMDYDRTKGYYTWNSLDVDEDEIGGGFGAAIDAGLTYSPSDMPGFTFSAAILDLGGISWKNTIYGTNYNVDRPFPTSLDNIQERVKDDSNFSFNDIIDDIKDEGEDLYSFKRGDVDSRTFEWLTFTANVGVEYKMPFYDRLSAGLLFTLRSDSVWNYAEGRFSLNWAPAKWLSMSASGACHSYGTSVGAALNIHPKFINFFIGADSIAFEVTPQGLPVGRMNEHFMFGLNVPLGKVKSE